MFFRKKKETPEISDRGSAVQPEGTRVKLYRCDPSRRMRGFFPIDSVVGIANLGLEIEDCFTQHDDTTQVEVWIERGPRDLYSEGEFQLFWIMEKKKAGGVRITTEDVSLEDALRLLQAERQLLEPVSELLTNAREQRA